MEIKYSIQGDDREGKLFASSTASPQKQGFPWIVATASCCSALAQSAELSKV
jgi:hypothetical protein